MIEYDQTRNEIFALFKTAWDANTAAIVGYVPEVRFQGVQYRALPESSRFWVRLSKDTVFEEQTTLSDCAGEPGKKRYTASGLVFVQLFCPKSNNESFNLGQRLAKVGRDAFRGKTTASKIWFRNTRINELTPEELYERFNVVTEFEYDELG